MGLRIATNVASLQAQRSLEKTSGDLNASLAKLSSGSRITKAADDSAGLAISEKLKAEIRSLNQARRNTNDGISLIQTAEGGLNEVSNILIRMRELSVQAASDTIGDDERGYINIEVQMLKAEVERISKSTEFNGNSLLDGNAAGILIQIGSNNVADVDNLLFSGEALNSGAEALGIAQVKTDSRTDASSNLQVLDSALQKVNASRAALGATQSRLQSTVNNNMVTVENLEAAKSRISDADIAAETAELARNQILNQSGISVLSQANTSGASALKLL